MSERERTTDRPAERDVVDATRDAGAHTFTRELATDRTLEAVPAAALLQEFEGNDQFEVEARLGEGGFGTVYRVFDRHRGVRLALKLLRRGTAPAVVDFKKEFRALAGAVHPNLVTLYDLATSRERVYFTMELVEGQPFHDYLGAIADPTERMKALRNGLTQLCEGLAFLHRGEKVHRDIKPSNVLVTAEGRVVILDFGLVRDIRTSVAPGQPLRVAGTPAYMSPEQAAGLPAGVTSDSYAVGVMLFEALTGRLPFGGTSDEMISRKQVLEPPKASELASQLPEDLVALCQELLQRDPDRRPTAEQILGRLGPASGLGANTPSDPWSEASFRGREREMQLLSLALAATRAGRCSWAVIEGTSGIGKTALVEHFLEELRKRDPGALILTGRCYERETVPFKALDGIIDGISEYLGSPTSLRALPALPDGLAALAALFPALAPLCQTPLGLAPLADARERFHQAARALRALIGQLCKSQLVVLGIDDLQWGDLDSAELLAAILDSSEVPPFLLVTSGRREEAESSPVLRALADWRERTRARVEVVEVRVESLQEGEAMDLALELLPASDRSRDEAKAIVREAGGSPFLIGELCRAGRLDAPETEETSLIGRSLFKRLASLPSADRDLLEIVAAAGRPLPKAVAFRAALIGQEDPAILARLRAQRLVRSRMGGESEALECYHDRIREPVAARLRPLAWKDCHARLARSLEESGSANPEHLAEHFRESGDLDRALHYLEKAATRAEDVLAFDLAARFYEEAIDLCVSPSPERLREMETKRASAAANAGHSAVAADAFERAAALAGGEEAAHLRRRAAEQVWRGGRIGAGLDASQAALESVGLRWRRSHLGAILNFLGQRLRLALRGLTVRVRPDRQVTEETRISIDTGYFFANFIVAIYPIAGIALHTQILLRALKGGDLRRIGRCLGVEAIYHAMKRGGEAKARALFRSAEELCEGAQPEFRAQLYASRATLALNVAALTECRHAAEQAEKMFIEHCPGTLTETAFVRWLRQTALFYLGDWNELRSAYEKHRHDCEQRDDVLWWMIGETHFGWLEPLLADDVAGARRALDEVYILERRVGERLAHSSPMITKSWIDRYEGLGGEALATLDRIRPELKRQGAHRVVVTEARYRVDHAGAALCAATEPGASDRSVRSAHKRALRDAAYLSSCGLEVGRAVAALIRAGCRAISEGAEASLADLEQAERLLRAEGLMAYAAAATRRRGEILGGDAGANLVAEADAFFERLGARQPKRFAQLLAPGW